MLNLVLDVFGCALLGVWECRQKLPAFPKGRRLSTVDRIGEEAVCEVRVWVMVTVI